MNACLSCSQQEYYSGLSDTGGDIPWNQNVITSYIGVIMSFARRLACSKQQFTMSDTYHARGAHSGSGRNNLQRCIILLHCSDLTTSSVAYATSPRQASAGTFHH